MQASTRRIMWSALALALLAATLVAAPSRADNSRFVSGWFGYWTSPATMVQVARASDGVLGEVNIFMWNYQGPDQPVCTYPDGDGCLRGSSTPWTTARFSEAIKGLQAQGVHVYATHTDLYSGRARSLSNYLDSAAHRREIAEQLTSWAVKSGVDGIDLDWENFAFNDGSSTWGATKPRFVKTMQILSEKLHAAGKTLSVTVPGGYAPFKNGSPNPGGGYWVYAWSEIAGYVDRLRLMAYDYSWNRPGPIGPHNWASEVVRGAVAQVGQANAHKIYIGVHSYGKAWYDRDGNDDYVTRGSCPSGWSPSGTDAVSLSPAEAVDLARAYGQTPRFDSASQEWTFNYVKSESGSYKNSKGKTRKQTCQVRKEVWYGDTRTAVGRARIAEQYKIGGVVVWQLAATNPDFYPKLKEFVGSAAPTLTASVSDSRPATGSTLTISGTLSGKPAGSRVKVQRKESKGKWATTGRAATDASGRVSFRVTLDKQAQTYRFRLRSGSVKSKAIRVVARPAPGISFSRTKSRAGARTKFRVRVSPGSKGQRVTRQIHENGEWISIETKGTRKDGRVAFRAKLYPKPQKYRYRVLVAASASTTSGVSSVMRFRSR